MADYWNRVRDHEKSYEPIEQPSFPFVKVINVGEKIIVWTDLLFKITVIEKNYVDPCMLGFGWTGKQHFWILAISYCILFNADPVELPMHPFEVIWLILRSVIPRRTKQHLPDYLVCTIWTLTDRASLQSRF